MHLILSLMFLQNKLTHYLNMIYTNFQITFLSALLIFQPLKEEKLTDTISQ